MKKFIVLFMMVLAMMSCADSKTFERADGTKFVAEPYGWDIVAIETVIVPVWLTGWELYEPVSYTEPNVTK